MMTKYIKEKAKIVGENNIKNNYSKDNSPKSQLYLRLKYIINLIFIFIFILAPNIHLNKNFNISNINNISYIHIIYVILYILYLNNYYINQKKYNEKYNNIFIQKIYLNDNIIYDSFSLNNEYINNKTSFCFEIKFKLFLNEINYMKGLKNFFVIILNKILYYINRYIKKLFYSFTFFIFLINLKEIRAYQEINITINGTGEQQILGENFDWDEMPNKIFVNGLLQSSDYIIK